jgi:hypothetical protein
MRGRALKGHLDLRLLPPLHDGVKHGHAVIEHFRKRARTMVSGAAGAEVRPHPRRGCS